MNEQPTIEDIIPPDVPVRSVRGDVYCHKQHAVADDVLVRDLSVIVFNQRYMHLPSGNYQAVYIGLCEHCGAMI